jgi:predicted transcriptional regulator of viral defense system
MACRKFGDGAVVGGRSALYYHGLITEPPKKIWIVVGSGQKTTSPNVRCLRTQFRFLTGTQNRQYFRVTSLERTLAECLKHSRKVGRRMTYKAVSKALEEVTTEHKLLSAAGELGIRRFVAGELARIPSKNF